MPKESRAKMPSYFVGAERHHIKADLVSLWSANMGVIMQAIISQQRPYTC